MIYFLTRIATAFVMVSVPLAYKHWERYGFRLFNRRPKKVDLSNLPRPTPAPEDPTIYKWTPEMDREEEK